MAALSSRMGTMQSCRAQTLKWGNLSNPWIRRITKHWEKEGKDGEVAAESVEIAQIRSFHSEVLIRCEFWQSFVAPMVTCGGWSQDVWGERWQCYILESQ